MRLKLRPCPEPFEDLVFGPTSYDVHAIEVRLIIIAIQVRFQPTLSWFKTACFYFAQPVDWFQLLFVDLNRCETEIFQI